MDIFEVTLGDASFAVELRSMSQNSSNTEVNQPHFHIDNELHIVLDGAATMRLDNKDIPTTAGDAYIIPPNVCHYYQDYTENFNKISCLFTLSKNHGTERSFSEYDYYNTDGILVTARNSFSKLTLSENCKSIGTYAFASTGLTSVAIPDSVTNIGKGAFSYCSNLTDATLSNNLTRIRERTFSGCTGLTSITIPDSVTSIEADAFSDCFALADVYYTGTASEWNAIDISSYNSDLTSATIYFYSATAPTASGNYWRYVNGVPTAW